MVSLKDLSSMLIVGVRFDEDVRTYAHSTM